MDYITMIDVVLRLVTILSAVLCKYYTIMSITYRDNLANYVEFLTRYYNLLQQFLYVNYLSQEIIKLT